MIPFHLTSASVRPPLCSNFCSTGESKSQYTLIAIVPTSSSAQDDEDEDEDEDDEDDEDQHKVEDEDDDEDDDDDDDKDDDEDECEDEESSGLHEGRNCGTVQFHGCSQLENPRAKKWYRSHQSIDIVRRGYTTRIMSLTTENTLEVAVGRDNMFLN